MQVSSVQVYCWLVLEIQNPNIERGWAALIDRSAGTEAKTRRGAEAD